MAMTEEQRKAAGERLRAGREAAAQTRAAAPAAPPPPSAEEMLIAMSQGQIEITNEDIFAMQARGTDGRVGPVAERAKEHQQAVVTHQTAAKRRLYKPTPHGYTPREVPVSHLAQNVKNGWLAACPDCGRTDCQANGDPNDCTGRPPRLFRVCPIASCGGVQGDGTFRRHRMYDPLPTGTVAGREAETASPFEIDDGAYDQSTPETRTLATFRAHMLAFHPQESPTYGVYPMAAQAPMMQPQVGTQAGQR